MSSSLELTEELIGLFETRRTPKFNLRKFKSALCYACGQSKAPGYFSRTQLGGKCRLNRRCRACIKGDVPISSPRSFVSNEQRETLQQREESSKACFTTLPALAHSGTDWFRCAALDDDISIVMVDDRRWVYTFNTARNEWDTGIESHTDAISERVLFNSMTDDAWQEVDAILAGIPERARSRTLTLCEQYLIIIGREDIFVLDLETMTVMCSQIAFPFEWAPKYVIMPSQNSMLNRRAVTLTLGYVRQIDEFDTCSNDLCSLITYFFAPGVLHLLTLRQEDEPWSFWGGKNAHVKIDVFDILLRRVPAVPARISDFIDSNDATYFD